MRTRIFTYGGKVSNLVITLKSEFEQTKKRAVAAATAQAQKEYQLSAIMAGVK